MPQLDLYLNKTVLKLVQLKLMKQYSESNQVNTFYSKLTLQRASLRHLHKTKDVLA